jgi:hypothetical protein
MMLLLLTGCAITKFGDTFEGAQDYRIVPAVDGAAVNVPADCLLKDRALDKENNGDALRIGLSLGCYSRFQYTPATNAATDPNQFAEGDAIAVSLKVARIAFFSEGFLETYSNKLFNSPLKGEIAIVANVTQGARSALGASNAARDEGKVVFYSGDVTPGQTLNEFNIPVFGPEKWSGGPLTIQFTVFELDEAEAKQYGDLLKTLSGLGRLTNVSPVETALQKLGTAFAAGNKDDVIGRFGLTLMPPKGGARGTDALLQVSDIIVQRGEGPNRGAGVAFDHCFYEPLQAKVYCQDKGKDGAAGKRVIPDRNSFIFSIRKARSATSIVSDLTLTQLNEKLAAAQSMAGVNQALSETMDRAVAATMATKADEAMAKLKDPTISPSSRKYVTDRLLRYMQCGALAQRASGLSPDAAKPLAVAMNDTCGVANAGQSLTSNDLENLKAKMVEQLSFEVENLTDEALVGSAPSAAGTLTTLRAGLYDLGKARTPSH